MMLLHLILPTKSLQIHHKFSSYHPTLLLFLNKTLHSDMHASHYLFPISILDLNTLRDTNCALSLGSIFFFTCYMHNFLLKFFDIIIYKHFCLWTLMRGWLSANVSILTSDQHYSNIWFNIWDVFLRHRPYLSASGVCCCCPIEKEITNPMIPLDIWLHLLPLPLAPFGWYLCLSSLCHVTLPTTHHF